MDNQCSHFSDCRDCTTLCSTRICQTSRFGKTVSTMLDDNRNMADSFTTLWTKERCKLLSRLGDDGPLSVIFGGPHLSMPTVKNVSEGDFIYPVLFTDGSLFIVARMKVKKVMPAKDYIRDELRIDVPEGTMWDSCYRTLLKERPELGHRLPHTCAYKAAVGEEGTEIRYDRKIPDKMLEELRFGPKQGSEKPLKGIKDGKLKHNHSLHGHVRRISIGSSKIFEDIINKYKSV